MSDDLLAQCRKLRDEHGWGKHPMGRALGIGPDAAHRLLLKLKREDELREAQGKAAPVEVTTNGEFHPLANLFPLIEGDEFTELVEDIRAKGLREPITILDLQILDGRNRYRACMAAGFKPTLILYDHELHGDPLEFVISKNLNRRHLNESQRAMVAARIATMRQGERTDLPPSANLPKVSQAAASRRLSISERALRAARSVQQHAEPEIARAVDRGHLAVSAAAAATKLPAETQRRIAEAAEAGDANTARHVIKTEQREARETALGAALASGNLALPQKRYGVILADPEWKFETWSSNGLDRSADNHYSTSETAKIAARPIQDIAAKDCVLFLWATAPMLPHALHVMAAWGFEYKSHRIWDKATPGTGYWFINVHELLLVGTRGNIPAPAPGSQPVSITREAKGPHSIKPTFAYEMIERWFPHLPKIELNARQARPGWDSWGLEAPASGDRTRPHDGDNLPESSKSEAAE